MKNIHPKPTKLTIHAVLSIVAIFGIVLLIYPAIKYSDDGIIVRLLWTFIGVAISQIIAFLIEKYSTADKGFCAHQKYLNEFGALKTYKSFYCDEYIEDLCYDLDNLSKQHNFKESPIIFMGVSLNWCLNGGTDNKEIPRRIKRIIEKAYVNFYICDVENREMSWRGRQIEIIKQTNTQLRLASQDKIKHNIEASIEVIEEFYAEYGEHIKYVTYKEAAPFATICIINNHIYYTPNLFRPFNWKYSEDAKDNEIRPGFCICRNSPFGKRIEQLFQDVYTLESLSVS